MDQTQQTGTGVRVNTPITPQVSELHNAQCIMLKPAKCFTRADGLGHIQSTSRVSASFAPFTQVARACPEHIQLAQSGCYNLIAAADGKSSTCTTNLCTGSEQQLCSQGSEFPSRTEPPKPIFCRHICLRIVRNCWIQLLCMFS